MAISQYITCQASEGCFYDPQQMSLAYVIGERVVGPLIDRVCRMAERLTCPTNELTCDESNLESKLNYLCSPGKHTKKSVVVGKRAKERKAVNAKVKEEPLLKEFEYSLNQAMNYFPIPDECKEMSEKVASLAFSGYIEKYRHCGLNETNAIDWRTEPPHENRVSVIGEGIWRVHAFGPKHHSFPSGLTAIKLLMQVEETDNVPPGWRIREGGDLLLSTLTAVMHVDEVVKLCKNTELFSEVDYQKTIKANEISIPVGKVANCYRSLTKTHGSLVDALLSPKSIRFIRTGICEEKTMEDFALQSHTERIRHCFDKTASSFTWLEKCPPDAMLCDDVYQLSNGENADVLLKNASSEDDCIDLKKAIIHTHAKLALEKRLSVNSPYGPHLAYFCTDLYCYSMGDLADVNGMDSVLRNILASKKITICPYTTSAQTYISDNRYQSLSTTVFGEIPKQIDDICLELHFKHF